MFSTSSTENRSFLTSKIRLEVFETEGYNHELTVACISILDVVTCRLWVHWRALVATCQSFRTHILPVSQALGHHHGLKSSARLGQGGEHLGRESPVALLALLVTSSCMLSAS